MIIKDLHQVEYRRFLFRVRDYFLCPGGDPDRAINYYIQCGTNAGKQLNEFHTLLVDLNQTTEEIFSGIQSAARTEIRSFLRNQSFDHEILQHLSSRDLKHYIDLFNDFAKFRGIRRAERSRLHAYNSAGILALSFIRQHNNYLCVNFYRLTKERATNLHSFPLKHTLGERYSQSHLGRAHRSLHWLDMMRFKEAGVRWYDLCGWYAGNSDKALLGINRFKEQFSSYRVREYSGVIYTNKLLLFLKQLR